MEGESGREDMSVGKELDIQSDMSDGQPLTDQDIKYGVWAKIQADGTKWVAIDGRWYEGTLEALRIGRAMLEVKDELYERVSNLRGIYESEYNPPWPDKYDAEAILDRVFGVEG